MRSRLAVMIVLSSSIILLTGVLPMISGLHAASPPSAPGGLTATLGTRRVSLVWTAPVSNGGAPVQGYSIYRGLASGGETPLTFVGTQTFYNDVGVQPGTTYYYKVTAYNSIGESIFSNEANVTTIPTPSPPRNLRAVTIPGQISLTWDPPLSNGGSPITGYYIYRRTVPGNDTRVDSSYNMTVATDLNVSPGLTYYYRVSAISDAGQSGLSNEAYATPSAAPPLFVSQILLEAAALWIVVSSAVLLAFLVMKRRKTRQPNVPSS
jgi:fibronectin type 3 domain-containing protein